MVNPVKWIRLGIMLAMVMGGLFGTAWASNPVKALDGSVEQMIATENDARELAETWAAEREGLQAELRELKSRDRWLAFQVEKYRTYVAHQEEEIARLDQRIRESEELRRELEPFLEETLARLEQQVAEDLPFLVEERQARLKRLRETLDDYQAGLAEKLRRVLEALIVETQYGQVLEQKSDTLVLGGEEVQANVFRMGRVALFYVTLDGHRAGFMERGSGSWQPLPERCAPELLRAMEMVDHRRAMELVELPIPRSVQ